jgi:hypothetical protein
MGADIVTLAKLTLNVSDPASVASEIAKRLRVNVSYAYQDTFSYDGTTLSDGSYETVEIGEVCIENARFNVRMYDHRYQFKQAKAQWGDTFVEACRKERFGSLMDVPDVWFELYKLNDEYDSFMRIENDCLEYDEPYFTRWWHFINILQGNFNSWDALMAYRKELRDGYRRLDVHEIVYLNDQQPKLNCYPDNWDQLLQSLEQYKGNGVHIPDLVRSGKRLENDDFPLFFTDDFSDLE